MNRTYQIWTIFVCVSFVLTACFPAGGVAEVLAKVPGQDQALDGQVHTGERIQVSGPPSQDHEPINPNDAYSLDAVREWIEMRKQIPQGTYQTTRQNWLTTQFQGDDLTTFARLARQKFSGLFIKQTPLPRLDEIGVEYLTLEYPAEYYHQSQPVTVHAKRLELRATDTFGDKRKLVVYFLNYDKIDSDARRVILQLHGHFGQNPSRMSIGLEQHGGLTGAAVAKIALRGYPVIVFDDHDVGESSPATGKEPGFIRTLANLRMVDHALLTHFERVDALGLSGGCERLFYFLIMHRCNLGSAYLSGFGMSPWTYLDARSQQDSPFGYNADTFDERFCSQFQWADFVLAGIEQGIDICIATQTNESGVPKYFLHEEVLPAIRRFTDRFELGGDDPDGDGIGNDGRNLHHEYDLPDFFDFLERSQTRIRPPTRNLFITNTHVRTLRHLTKTIHQPVKHPKNPIIKADKPWESRTLSHYGTVLRDPNEGLFKYWYNAAPATEDVLKVDGKEYAKKGLVLCYATSRDGIYWYKPNLKQVAYNGSLRNNIVHLGEYSPTGAGIVIDESDPNPNRRFKSFFWEHVPLAIRATGVDGTRDGMWVAYSPDGLRWTSEPHNPVLPGYSDVPAYVVRDPTSSRFMAYSRFGFNRTLAYTSSEDFLHWSQPESVLEPDDQETTGNWPATQFYGMSVDLYEGLYLGGLWMYRPGTDGRIDTQLVASHDGIHWERVGDRQTWLPLGPESALDDGMVRTASEMIPVDDKIYIYFGMVNGPHAGSRFPGQDIQRSHPGAIGLATLRRDGFVSLDADDKPGFVLTKPVKLDGCALHLNVDVRPGGFARVVACDPWLTLEDSQAQLSAVRTNESHPRYKVDVNYDEDGHLTEELTSATITGNHLDTEVRWPSGGWQFATGKICALRIELKNAKLYSYWWD